MAYYAGELYNVVRQRGVFRHQLIQNPEVWGLYNVVRQGRGVPAVPIVLLGIEL